MFLANREESLESGLRFFLPGGLSLPWDKFGVTCDDTGGQEYTENGEGEGKGNGGLGPQSKRGGFKVSACWG